MIFPIYFYLTLLVLSPWPICYSLIFYFRYRWDTTFEYFITSHKQLYKYWSTLTFLPLLCSSIFLLRYRRIGISLDIWKLKNTLLETINPLSYLDLSLLGIFALLFIISWILLLRVVYQYFRKCLLALHLYYWQYWKVYSFYLDMLAFNVYYNHYLWARVKVFKDTERAHTITMLIWPFSTNILERNLYNFILPYVVIFDLLIENGVITKLFILLPWYYIYSLIRFALKFFYAIAKPANWDIAERMYGYPQHPKLRG